MTDKPEATHQSDTENEQSADASPPEKTNTSTGDDFGVESALAALGELAGYSESEESGADEPADDPDASDEETALDAAPVAPADAAVLAAADVPDDDDESSAMTPAPDSSAVPADTGSYQPPETSLAPGGKLYRGQAASVVPALLLIGIGAVLTFLLTTSDTALDPLTGGALAIMVGGVALLAHWFSADRRATGNLFIGLTLLLGGGLGAYALQSGGVTLQTAWPLLLLIPGGALLATALMSREAFRQAALIGLLLLLAGAGGFVLTEFIL